MLWWKQYPLKRHKALGKYGYSHSIHTVVFWGTALTYTLKSRVYLPLPLSAHSLRQSESNLAKISWIFNGIKNYEHYSVNNRNCHINISEITHDLTETQILVSPIRMSLWVWMFVQCTCEWNLRYLIQYPRSHIPSLLVLSSEMIYNRL